MNGSESDENMTVCVRVWGGEGLPLLMDDRFLWSIVPQEPDPRLISPFPRHHDNGPPSDWRRRSEPPLGVWSLPLPLIYPSSSSSTSSILSLFLFSSISVLFLSFTAAALSLLPLDHLMFNVAVCLRHQYWRVLMQNRKESSTFITTSWVKTCRNPLLLSEV